MPRLLNHLTRKRTLAESSKIRGEVFWERHLKVEWVAGNGVIEAKAPGMEELAGGRIGKAPVKGRLAIKCIADDGGAKGGEMNTDLVGAPGLNVAFYTSNPKTGQRTHPPPTPNTRGTTISAHPLRMIASLSRLSFSYIAEPSLSFGRRAQFPHIVAKPRQPCRTPQRRGDRPPSRWPPRRAPDAALSAPYPSMAARSQASDSSRKAPSRSA